MISTAFLGCFLVCDKWQLTVWIRLSRGVTTASGSLAQVELLRSFPYFKLSCQHPLSRVALWVSLVDPGVRTLAQESSFKGPAGIAK